MNNTYFWFVGVILGAVLNAHAGAIRFEDATEATGLAVHLKPWQLGHAASWGDLDGDGWPELYVGAFADPPRWKEGPLPNMLFHNEKGLRFTLDSQAAIQFERRNTRTSQILLADLDQDGDLDLVVATHANKPDAFPATLWENRDGTFHERDPRANGGYWPFPIGYRNLAAVDLNGDGLLDIAACDNNYSNWKSGKGSLLILINKGDFRFEDGREQFGFPPDGTTGFGLAVGDVNDDGHIDFFVADANRLFVSTHDGRYTESQAGLFLKPQGRDRESKTCGATFGDLNGDGLLDLVTAEHGRRAQVRLYINRGIRDGLPYFQPATQEAGLDGPLPERGIDGAVIKVGHVAIADFDNDGRRDIWLSVLWREADGRLQPMVFRNEGNGKNGVPRFSRPPFDRVVGYYASAPIADFDRDGRIDGFMAAWFDWKQTPSILFRNVTASGHWLTVRVKGGGVRNTMGIGVVVRAYAAGGSDDAAAFIQRADIVTGTGYASGEEALAHLGLGSHATVDLVIRWGTETRHLKDVAADQMLVVDWSADNQTPTGTP